MYLQVAERRAFDARVHQGGEGAPSGVLGREHRRLNYPVADLRSDAMDAAAWIGLVISVLAVLVAIGVPLAIERAKWPELRVDEAEDANMRHLHPVGRIVHVRVTNRPLEGWRGRWLLRNTANGCKVAVTFRSRSDGKVTEMQGRWSATPQPAAR